MLLQKKARNKLAEEKSKNEKKDDEEENEEDEDFYEDDENEEEFLEKMKNLNKKRKDDDSEMELYRKENRKMLARLEDALDDKDELTQKMKQIEELVAKQQNELYSSLKKYFSRILSDLNISNKNEENIKKFMKVMLFSEEDINSVISSKPKKNFQFNTFKQIIQHFFIIF